MRRRDKRAEELRQRAADAEAFRKELKAFLRKEMKGVSHRAVGMNAVRDPNFVFQILDEVRVPRSETIERFRRYMAEIRSAREREQAEAAAAATAAAAAQPQEPGRTKPKLRDKKGEGT